MSETTNIPATLARPLGQVEGVRLIAMREIITTIRSRAFVWSFVVMLAITAVMILGQSLVGNLLASLATGDEETTVVSTVDLGELEEGLMIVLPAGSAEEALAKVQSGEAEAAVITGEETVDLELFSSDGSPLPVGVYTDSPLVVVGNDSVPGSIVDLLTVYPATAYLVGEAVTEFWLTFIIATAFAVLYFTGIMMFSQRIAQTVIEEKASRIVELLLATVKPGTVLAGKVIGGTIMAFAEVVGIVVVALVCFAITGQTEVLGMLGPAMIWFTALFLVGFILFASLYAALSATVSQPEDVASATSPLNFLVMIPYLLVIVANQNQVLMAWLSYIPFSAPVAMPVRIFSGTAEWWEPLVALAILVVTVVFAIWIAARIYENSVLRVGTKVKLSDALRG